MTTIAYITSSTSNTIFDANITDVQDILAIVSDYVKKHPGSDVNSTSDQWVLALSNVPYTSNGPRAAETTRVKGKLTGNYLLSSLLLDRNTNGKIDQSSMDVLNGLAASVEAEILAGETTVELMLVSVSFVPSIRTIGIPITVIGASFTDNSSVLSVSRQVAIQKSTLLFDSQKLTDAGNVAAWKKFADLASWKRVSQEVTIVQIGL
jgi:hypothetical protein